VLIGSGFTRSWFTKLLAEAGCPNPGEAMDDMASSVPVGSDGAFFYPHLGGQNGPLIPTARGAWAGLSWEHGLGHLSRALLESIALDCCCVLRAMGGLDDDQPIISYGGGTRSRMAMQIKADAVGRAFHSLGDITPGTRGAAILGAWAVGDLDGQSLDSWEKLPIAERYLPNAGQHRRYRPLLDKYVEVGATIASIPLLQKGQL
jgi:xylulokinase